jgi:hypothetical protein
MDWVAAIGAAPGWAATYGDLTYDRATDKALLSGLRIEYATAQVSIAFEPISITGYAEQPDGSFGATQVTIHGATLTAGTVAVAIADVRLDGLGDIPRALGGGFTWDQQQPFTSMMRAYAPLTDIRLRHGGIGAMAVVATAEDGSTVISYKDISIDGWADGKVLSARAGRTTIETETPDGALKFGVGSMEARDIDYAAMRRVYDPDQYVDGVGDQIWRPAVGLIGYHDIAIDGPDTKVTIAAVTAEGYRVRQPERSIAAVFDKIMRDPSADEDLTTEEMRTVVGLASAFAIDRMAARDIDVEAAGEGQGHLGGVTIADFSAERIGEFSINDVSVAIDAGSAKIGRIALGGMVFPDLEGLIEAAEAEEAGEEVDYNALAVKLGFIEALKVDVETADRERVQLAKARLDLSNHVGSIPTLIGLDIAGLDVPASVIDDEAMRTMWQALGYDRILADCTVKLAWKEQDDSVVVDDFRFVVADVAAVSLSGVLGGLGREALEDLEKLPEALENLALVRGTLTVEDDSLMDRWIRLQAAAAGVEPADLREQIAQSLPDMIAGIGGESFQEQLLPVLQAFVMRYGSITATAAPVAPIPVAALAVLAETAPQSLPDLLGVTVAGVAGKGPAASEEPAPQPQGPAQ